MTLDFSENYAFKIQEAIRSHYWVNSHATTIHPYAVYAKKGNDVIPKCFFIIGGNGRHDAVAVYLFIKTLIHYLTKKYGARKIRKIIYFSDGAMSQYKNRNIFINLVNHKTDSKIETKGHF